MRFGLPPQDQNITESQWYVRDLKGKSEKHLRAYTSMFVQHLCDAGDPASKTFEDNVPKEGININQVLARIGMVSLIRKKVHEYEGKHGLESIPKPKPKILPKTNDTSKDFAEFEDNSQNSSVATEDKTANNGSENVEKMDVSDSGQTAEEEPKSDIKTDDTTEPKSDTEAKPELKVEQTSAEQKSDEVMSEVKPEGKTDEPIDKGTDESGVQKTEETEVKDIEMKDVEKSEDKSEVKESEEKKEETVKESVNGKAEEDIENGVDTIEEIPKTVQKFDFNIRDGGFTELQTLWFFEEQELKPGKEAEIWHRRHDYWLLASLVKHGYERWKDIHEDDTFSILSEPFKSSIHIKNKFMERRLRLLEQALVFEEQFRRTAHLGRLTTTKPEDKDKEEQNSEESDSKEEEANDENRPLNATLHRCINQYEELMTDMKSDCGRIPQTVQRIPPIAQRLQISQKSLNQMGHQKQRHFQM